MPPLFFLFYTLTVHKATIMHIMMHLFDLCTFGCFYLINAFLYAFSGE